jgi:S1-C subfamily serine protease
MTFVAKITSIHWSVGALTLCLAAGNAAALEPDVLFKRVSPSVWVVRTFDAQERPLLAGSAVVVAPGRLVTNCHVLAKASSLVIRQDNVSYGATLEYPDVERDLCQIKVANFHAPAVAIAPASSVRVGQKVYAIGSPRGLENTLSEGLLSGLRGGGEQAGEKRLLQLTAALSPGSSGGGLFDSEGRLLGITSFGMREGSDLNFAIPAELIAEIPGRAQVALAQRTHGDGAATGAAAPARTTGETLGIADALRAGDALEYVLTDRATGNRSPVIYRVDRIVGDELVFNMGGRVEKSDGRVVSLTATTGGIFDSSSPPGGWGRKDAKPGMRWHLDYQATTGDKWRHELDAAAIGERTMRVDGAEVKAMQITYRGWIYGILGRHGSVGPLVNMPFEATAWYAVDMGRVIRFEAKFREIGRPTSESLELVRVLR